MAGGALILQSSRMSGAGGTSSAMLISDLSFSQTAACTSSGCSIGGACMCSGVFFNIPQGRQLYALSAEVQCNGGSRGKYNITAPSLYSVQAAVVQPPISCQGSCDVSSAILLPSDVTSLATTGGLSFGASVSSVGQDLCMAGQHLKVFFTLQYSAS